MSARDELLREMVHNHLYMTDERATELLDAYRAEVLAETGQIYDGELLMLRGLVKVLRVAARQGDLAAVQQALVNHAADDGDARAREKSSRKAADATPDFFQPGRSYRLGQRHIFLCTVIDTNPGTGEPHAVGWAYDTHTERWRVTDLTNASWQSGWTDATEAGEGS